MDVIVFVLLDTASHLNASLKLARSLKSRGYSIVYLANPDNQTKIEDMGFMFFSKPKSYQLEEIAKNAPSAQVLKKELEKGFLKGDLFKEVIHTFDPVLILLDTSLIYYSVYLKKINAPFFTISTKVCQNRTPYVPPFQSEYLPHKRNFFSRLRVEGIWQVHLLKKRWKDFMDDRSKGKISRFMLAKRYLKEKKLDVAGLMVIQRSSHFGWKDIPELILSPMHFDFPRTIPPNQKYIGPVVDTERTEDKSNLQALKEILENKKMTVYCSMGAYDRMYRMDRVRFFLKLINLFLLKDDLQLIIATGGDIDPSRFKPLPKNVKLFQQVPQLYLIKNVDLVISHGGMQSVTECIIHEAPMLIYPLNPGLDQNGNAARVEYHRLGLKGNIKKDTLGKIESKITRILENRGFYIDGIRKMKQKMLNCGDFEEGVNFIIDYIINNKKGNARFTINKGKQ